MLTREILASNAVLAGLTEEQVSAITTLSQNDENAVIAKKTGEIYGALDADILAVTGMAKNGTEKTYDYAKRVMGEMKATAEGAAALQSQIDGLTKEKARLEKVIANGSSDAETAKELKQAKADLASITAQYKELFEKHSNQQAEHEREIFSMRVDNALSAASGSLKFKAGLPEAVTRVLLQQASEKIKGMNPELIDDGNGGKMLAFKGEDGAILRNPENQLNPFTPAELLTRELAAMGVLETGRKQQGGGTQPPRGGVGSGVAAVDVSQAKNQQEAYDIIADTLMRQGKTIGSDEFEKAMRQAWKDNNIQALPIR